MITCAFVAAVLSVQSNFTNALILFAIICGAAVVLWKNRAWSKIYLLLTIGAVAALSLLPYLPIMKATADWSKILASQNNFAGIVAVGRDAIASSGAFSEWVWIALVAARSRCAHRVLFGIWERKASSAID